MPKALNDSLSHWVTATFIPWPTWPSGPSPPPLSPSYLVTLTQAHLASVCFPWTLKCSQLSVFILGSPCALMGPHASCTWLHCRNINVPDCRVLGETNLQYYFKSYMHLSSFLKYKLLNSETHFALKGYRRYCIPV